MGLRVQNTYEVIEYVLNKSYGFKSLTGPLQSFTTYAFNINKGYTLVELSLQANAVSLLGVNENILKKKMRKQIKENLALLKSILESE